MGAKYSVRSAFVVLGLVLAGGCAQESPPLVGSLEWDRIAVTAELAEPVLRWAVAEGQRVEAGEMLLELDPARQDTRLAQARAQLSQVEARLSELASGARIEVIDAARANLARARAAQEDAEREYTRVDAVRKQELVSAAALDQALAVRNQRRAETRAAEAQLRELTAGTRPEQIEQAAAAVDAARAAVRQAELTRQRLTVRAPRAGRVDALPFKPGDQPPMGAEVASLLVGEAPYARVFVSAQRRPAFAPGDAFDVQVEGVQQKFPAILRSIRNEASFTPYYALAGDDASRLVYRAELVLQGADAAQLPAGLPLTATPQDASGDAGE